MRKSVAESTINRPTHVHGELSLTKQSSRPTTNNSTARHKNAASPLECRSIFTMQMGSTNFTAAADGVANQARSPSIDVDDHLKFSKTNKDIDLENDKSISSIITYTKNSSVANLR